ncbi:MAG: hypothetical protein NT013_14035 [Planctomycetia bacterium]|nr:hypothetical protein [Planctomycetia bacterium]
MSLSTPQASSRTASGEKPARLSWTIFLVSVVGLLLEMMLIRWIGTEIRIFAYLQNTVLIVCFLALGMGCFSCRQPVQLARGLASFMVLTALLSVPFLKPLSQQITHQLGAFGDLVIWHQIFLQSGWQTLIQVACGLVMTFAIILLLWEVFLPMGRLLGRSMDDHPRTIFAYSVNVAGSLLGIWLFVLLSGLATGPIVWVCVSALILAFIAWNQTDRRQSLGCLAATVLLAGFSTKEPNAVEIAWSPYQKLTFAPASYQDWEGTNFILVNNTGYQALIDNSDAKVRSNPKVPTELHGLTQYDVPLAFHTQPERVLVVGAGSGNDVAGALRGGAKRVVAVEIDPAIIDFGRRFHPEHPYDSPLVHVVNDDARSYFATSQEKFDVIIFGLLDSHTTTSMTNARLDHYVYTKESLTRARSLLAEGGTMVLSFDCARNFIADRMSLCLKETFGQDPLAFRIPHNSTGWGGTVFVAGDQSVISHQLATNHHLQDQVSRWQAENPLTLPHTTRIATDDWPYIYLAGPSVPTLYLLLAVLLIALVGYGRRRLQSNDMFTGWNRSQAHFFFLGAAFMLLEVQNISKASVVLGNTWLVNAVIVSGIMVMILLSNFIAEKFPRIPQSAAATGLLGLCVALYFVDLSSFAFLPFVTKSLLVGSLTTMPMLFSGLIFIDSFSKTKDKNLALGANLLGALVGGILQSVTFLIGIKALLLLVAGLYSIALLLKPQSVAVHSTAQHEPDETADQILSELVELSGQIQVVQLHQQQSIKEVEAI